MTALALFFLAVIVLVSIWLSKISSKVGIPTLLVFLLLGMIFAQTGLTPSRIENFNLSKEICSAGLIFIMFYGGFGTRWKAVKPVVGESALLATAGVFITAGLTGVFCHFVLGWKWLEGMLLGSVLGSTDAASVFAILKSRRLGLKNNTSPMLEMESGSNDPAAYMLTLIFLSILNGDATGGTIVWNLFAQIVFGAGCGAVIAFVAVRILRNATFSSAGYDSLFVLAVAVASYAVPTLIGGNGYLSAYIVGIILGNEEFGDKRSLVNFFDGITSLMQMLIFFLLGMLARPSTLVSAILPALAVFAFLLLVGRPAAVFSLLSPFRKYPSRQKALISFVGLRGASSIVFAIMAVVGYPFLDGDIFNIVFIVVILSIALQGSLIPLASRQLDMIDEGSDVLKTFNDYSENEGLSFGRINIAEDSSWAGKRVGDLNLPQGELLVLILRGGQRIQPHGATVIKPGDEVIILTKGFQDSSTALYEKTIKPGSRRIGHSIAEFKGKGLIVMIRRGGENIVPNGDTIFQEGDRIVILYVDSPA